MTGEDKMADVERQIAAIEKGLQAAIVCPYCDAVTERNKLLCCMTLAKAVRAILQRQVVTKELPEMAQRIEDALCN